MEEVFRSDAQEREITLSDFLLQVCTCKEFESSRKGSMGWVAARKGFGLGNAQEEGKMLVVFCLPPSRGRSDNWYYACLADAGYRSALQQQVNRSQNKTTIPMSQPGPSGWTSTHGVAALRDNKANKMPSIDRKKK